VNGVNELLYLPAPGNGVFAPEPWVTVPERGRYETPPGQARASGADAQAAGRGHVGYRANAGEPAHRPPHGAGHLVRRGAYGYDENADAGGAFDAQRLAQETARPGLFIDRSAEAAQAYGARAGFAAHRAATGSNLNIAV